MAVNELPQLAFAYTCECKNVKCRLRVRVRTDEWERQSKRGRIVSSRCVDAHDPTMTVLERRPGYAVIRANQNVRPNTPEVQADRARAREYTRRRKRDSMGTLSLLQLAQRDAA